MILNATGWVSAYSSFSPSLDVWHTIQLYLTEGAANGTAELYVDGELACSIQNLNTTAVGRRQPGSLRTRRSLRSRTHNSLHRLLPNIRRPTMGHHSRRHCQHARLNNRRTRIRIHTRQPKLEPSSRRQRRRKSQHERSDNGRTALRRTILLTPCATRNSRAPNMEIYAYTLQSNITTDVKKKRRGHCSL